MAISRISSVSAEAASVTLGTHAAGDLLLIFAYRDGVATAPSLPAGWTTFSSQTAGSNASRVGFRLAESAAETSGTWTNATEIICVVYRGIDQVVPVTGVSPKRTDSNGTGTTVTYGALGSYGKNDCWVFGFAGHRSTDTALETPPTNLFLVISQAGATAEAAAHDSNGGAANWPSTNVAVGGTSSDWLTTMGWIFPPQMKFNNYQHASASVGNTGILSVTEKTR